MLYNASYAEEGSDSDPKSAMGICRREPTVWDCRNVEKGVLNMYEMKIRLENMDHVREFIQAATTCSCDVDVRYNHIFLDGKSLLGVASAAASNVLIVDCPEPSESFCKVVNQFAVA